MMDVELELSGVDFAAFRQMMEDTALQSDEVRIDWLLEQMRDAKVKIEQNNSVAKARIHMIEDWQAGENAKIMRRIEWWIGEIGKIAPATADATKDEYGTKSRSLPNGSFGFKKRPDHIEITDPGGALEDARVGGLDIAVKEYVTKTTLKNHAVATGDTEGRGWRLVPGGDEFFVTPAK